MLEFQLTTSQGGRQIFSSFEHPIKIYFNSRPHKEVDWVKLVTCTLKRYFNSRPHKEVDGQSQENNLDICVFQLTTSQGGRPWFRFNGAWNSNFNSRPHKEVDANSAFFLKLMQLIFQLTTSQGGRRQTSRVRQRLLLFQLTTSQGGRPLIIISKKLEIYFNSRPHKEVDSNFYTKSFPFKITFCAHCI